MSVLEVPFRGGHVASSSRNNNNKKVVEKPAQTFQLPLPVAAAICTVDVIAPPVLPFSHSHSLPFSLPV